MDTLSVRRCAVLCAASLALWIAGCSGAGNALTPNAAAGFAQHTGSWMANGLTNEALLYVTNSDGLVNVYDYSTHALVGILTDFTTPMGECVDRAGDVYITDYAKKTIAEYAHGGTKPIHEIQESYQPYGCAIDPKTGNLAVANYGETYQAPRHAYEGDGNLAIYKDAKGSPIYYGTQTEHFTSCGYDKYGDLLAAFLEGYSGYYETQFGYLRVHTKKLTTISLPGGESSYYWGFVPEITWDGDYFDVDSGTVYRYSINIKPELHDKLTLSNAGNLGPIGLYRSTLKAKPTQIAGASDEDSGEGLLTIWKYPSGGSPIYQTSHYLNNPYGVAVSPGS